MKTRTVKKALSLFLAVLMIALAIPFTFMTASAEDTAAQKVEIDSFSAFGKYADGYNVAFRGSYPAANAFDGDLVNGVKSKDGGGYFESDAQIEAKGGGYKYCYLDENGNMQHGANNGDDYFLFFIIELADNAVVVDSLNLWTPESYYGDGWWMCNDGYEIYYSEDGSTYTDAGIEDAKFYDVYTGGKYETLYEAETYVNADGEDQAGYVHKIEMNDVTAKYIAIGIYGLASGAEAILTEVEVMGTPVVNPYIGVNKLTAFGNWVEDYEPISFRNEPPSRVWTEDKAYDGDITSDAQTWPGANRDDFVMTHFDANGGMKQGPAEIGTSYFGIFVVELDDYAKIDTLSLWTPYVNDSDPANRPYMANNGYDIYYSVDGASYTAVDGASFTDIYKKQSTADALYVEGTYNGKSGNVHNIDMGGVTAGYIAIAVSDLVYNATDIIFSEIVVEGEYTDAPKGDIKSFKPYGNGVGFLGSYNAERAFDRNIVTEAQTIPNANLAPKSFGELMGGTNNADAAGKSYYCLFEVELYEETEVSSLSLWTSYYDHVLDNGTYDGEYMSNNAYDIYYSADGVNYYAVKDATFENVYSDKDNNGYYVESMYGSDKGHVHDIDMRDVKARYIVIAVSETVYNNNEYMIFWDVAVHGTPTALEIDKVDAFGRHLVPETGATQNFSFYSDYPISNAFDGDITSDAQNANHNRNGETIKDYEMCYFDADGVMANGENPDADGKSYYLIFVIRLEDYAQVDTLSLWTPYANADGPTDVYMANNGYDIYYSVDGTSYTAVDGATFEDVYDKQSTNDALYVVGTYNGKNGYVHNIDMGSVEAKYIAIAVSDIVRYRGDWNNDEAIISEVTVNGGAPKKALDRGASVRMDDPTGIRFTGTVARTYYDRLVKDYGEDNVKLGMLISPTEYLENVDEFTKEAFDNWSFAKTKYIEIDADTILADGNDSYRINCALVNIKTDNVQREFSARLYIKVTNGGETEYIYSGFSKTGNSRSVAYVATAALSDLSDEANSTYKNAVNIYGETKYSPYDEDERAVLEGFSSKSAAITVMTYNIKVYGEGDYWDKITGNEEGWDGRDPVYALETITEMMPDIVGLQEDDSNLYAEYSKVPGLSEYTRFNSNGNGNEGNEILVKTAKFNVIDDGVEYFKELADDYSGHGDVSDSRVDWDNDTKGDTVNGKAKGRFFRWVLVEDKATKEQFLVVNTHLHYKAWLTDDEATNADCNKYLRRAQATLIRLWLLDMSETCENQIVMGDLNSDQNAHSTKGLLSGIGALDQAATDATIAVNVGGTLIDGYSTRNSNVYDHIFYNGDSLNAIEYVVVDNYDEDAPTLYPSDHLPVYAKFIAK